MSHPNILDASNTVLVVIDIQDSLMRAIHESDRVTTNSVRLIEAAKLFGVPVITTVQVSSKLGPCSDAIAAALPSSEVIDKTTFSCCGSEEFIKEIDATGRKQALLCGVETHVCVSQTAHELLARGYQVHVAKDAVSSRTFENWRIGIEKMRDSGCVITCTEGAIFELTKDASREQFRDVLKLVK